MCAQSSGEWPGSRRTFLEGRVEGGRVEVDGERSEDVEGVRPGGTRKMEAAEGGGWREVVLDVFGRFREVVVLRFCEGVATEVTNKEDFSVGTGLKAGGGIAFRVCSRHSSSPKGFFILVVALICDLFDSSLCAPGAVTVTPGCSFSCKLCTSSGSGALPLPACLASENLEGCEGNVKILYL